MSYESTFNFRRLDKLLYLRQNNVQMACETNAGLESINAEMLESTIAFLNLYEMWNEVKQIFKDEI